MFFRDRTVREDLVAAVLGEQVVREVAGILGLRRIEVMPIKGVLLHKLLYSDAPEQRRITDADVLVPEPRFREARAALQEAGYGFRTWAPSRVECSLTAPSGMVLDLHARLFAPFRYRMPTAEVIGRGRADRELFGAQVCLPDDLDVYAHMVGSLASDHLDGRASSRIRDLRLWPQVRELAVEPTARHLVACGVQRAARYTLGIVVDATGDAFSASVLRALPRDPVGAVIARGARAVVERLPEGAAKGGLAAHLLNWSVGAAAGAVGVAGLRRRPRGDP